jgi:hypothetical protein
VNGAGLGPNVATNISQRLIPEEPLYRAYMILPLDASLTFISAVIANLGLSKNFGTVDTANLVFPSHLRVSAPTNPEIVV